MYRYNSRRSSCFLLGLRSVSAGGQSFLLCLTEKIFQMMDHARQRRALARLDERMLKDIGLTRDEVDSELSRPFWR